MRVQILALAALCGVGGRAAAQVGPPVTRQEMISRAEVYAYHTWTATAVNVTPRDNCVPGWSTKYVAGTYVGLPYDWGGWSTAEEFDAKLAAGELVGSHSWHGVTECTIGQDCSGLISRSWGLTYKVGTSNLAEAKLTTEVGSVAEMKPGDIWNKANSHVRLHAYFRTDGTPAFYEAAGTPDKVWLSTSTFTAMLNDGYTLRRYVKVQEGGAEAALGSHDDPVVVDHFPYVDKRTTILPGANLFDTYSCAPSVSELGPEVVYRVVLPAAGALSVAVTDEVGVDVDVQLLSALDPASCLARGDLSLSHHAAAAGELYVVVDSYANIPKEYPGPYTATFTFTPDTPPAPTPLPKPTPAPPAPTDAPPAPTPAKAGGGGGCSCDGGGAALLVVAGLRRRRRGRARYLNVESEEG